MSTLSNKKKYDTEWWYLGEKINNRTVSLDGYYFTLLNWKYRAGLSQESCLLGLSKVRVFPSSKYFLTWWLLVVRSFGRVCISSRQIIIIWFKGSWEEWIIRRSSTEEMHICRRHQHQQASLMLIINHTYSKVSKPSTKTTSIQYNDIDRRRLLRIKHRISVSHKNKLCCEQNTTQPFFLLLSSRCLPFPKPSCVWWHLHRRLPPPRLVM